MLIYLLLICILSFNCYFFVEIFKEAIYLDQLNDCSNKIGGNLDAVAHRSKMRTLPPPACRRRSDQTTVLVT